MYFSISMYLQIKLDYSTKFPDAADVKGTWPQFREALEVYIKSKRIPDDFSTLFDTFDKLPDSTFNFRKTLFKNFCLFESCF